METDIKKQNLVAQASIVVNAPREQVWSALTDRESIKQYMFGAEVDTDWKKGSPITWKGEWKGKRYEDKGTVLQVEPLQLLQYSHFSPLTGEQDVPENYHTVTITLSEEDEGTFIALSQDKNSNDESRKHSEENWNMILQGLKKSVEGK